MTKLLELCILGLGSNEDGNVGISVFPEREEVLILGAGLGGGVGECTSTRELQMCQRANGDYRILDGWRHPEAQLGRKKAAQKSKASPTVGVAGMPSLVKSTNCLVAELKPRPANLRLS